MGIRFADYIMCFISETKNFQGGMKVKIPKFLYEKSAKNAADRSIMKRNENETFHQNNDIRRGAFGSRIRACFL